MTEIVKSSNLSLASWTKNVQRSALQLMLTGTPPEISFALGLPAPELFPQDDLAEAADKVLREHGRVALQYGPPSMLLKEQIAALMKTRGISVTTDQVFITSGAQQGISLCAALLLDLRGSVICEQLAYTGFQQALRPLTPQVLSVESDLSTGIDVDAVEELLGLGVRPGLTYIMSEGHNPLGISMSVEKRQQLADLASHYRSPVIEDDAYGFLQYTQALSSPVYSYGDGSVIYIGSFSKILCPAVRAGWIIAPKELMPLFAYIKESADIDCCPFSHRVLSAYLLSGKLPVHIANLRSQYELRRDTMLKGLATFFPVGTTWTHPSAGFFIWVSLPDGVDANVLLKTSLATERVAFFPGDTFVVQEAPRVSRCMRLNFSHLSAEQITEGIERLGRLVREMVSTIERDSTGTAEMSTNRGRE